MNKFGKTLLTVCFFIPIATLQAFDESAFRALPDSAVVVSVGKSALTKAELQKRAQFFKKVLTLNAASGNRCRALCEPGPALVENFINSARLVEYARQEGIRASITDRNRAELAFVRTYFDEDATGTSSFRVKLTNEERVAYDVILDVKATEEAVSAKVRGSVQAVTDDEVKAFRQKMLDWNVSAKRYLPIIFEKATNIWQRIEKTGDFEKEAACFADGKVEHITADLDWGEFPLSFFDSDPALTHALRKMNPGDVTPPILADNGLMIVKLIGKDPTAESGISYHLANIFFELPGIWKDRSDEQLKADMLYDRQQEHYEKTMKKLRDEARIDYPNGRDWIYRPARFRNRGKSLRRN